MTTTASAQATPFIAAHEGFVSKTYRDSGGVLTIGYGFTNLSTVFLAYWKAKYGRPLRMGDTITRAEADQVLAKLIATEYAPPVDRAMPDVILQNQFDGATSVSFNAGPGSMKDRWAVALAKGDVAEAARLLRSTRVTAGVRKLLGLVRRRADEARLIETGDYGNPKINSAESITGAEIEAYQKDLIALGHLKGKADGIAGRETIAAVKAFQKAAGLVVDGEVGPATRAALQRAKDAKGAKTATTAAGATGGLAGGGTDIATSPPPNASVPDVTTVPDFAWHALGWGLAAAGVILVLFLLWRYRGVIRGKRTPA